MSNYRYIKKKEKKWYQRKLTSTQTRFLMVLVIALVLFSVQLVMYLKK